MYTTYVLWSATKGRFYVGHTSDMQDRLERHNSGKSRSTKPGAPWELFHTEEFPTRSQAVRRERELKGWKSADRLRELGERPASRDRHFQLGANLLEPNVGDAVLLGE